MNKVEIREKEIIKIFKEISYERHNGVIWGVQNKLYSGCDIIEEIKKKLANRNEAVYQEWEREHFDINHQFLIVYEGGQYDTRIRKRTTLFHIAVANDSIVADDLMKKKININAQDEDGRTPLYHATLSDNTRVIEKLINAGANIKLRDKDGRTPYYWAVCGDKLNAAKIFIRNGVCHSSLKNKDGSFPHISDRMQAQISWLDRYRIGSKVAIGTVLAACIFLAPLPQRINAVDVLLFMVAASIVYIAIKSTSPPTLLEEVNKSKMINKNVNKRFKTLSDLEGDRFDFWWK